ncbi:YchF/TatD family DNA exonuclease [Testudinibacter sp. TR-2022]|uniref:YchF/TatD family DNA exonuclease n=1 Tax=Testudinibacter sp. TR-2022 TaxID=2585029 RepID=UPI00111A533F|nr:YchF/TatD family DNA exonuclease [Testudinibacter sp. TR-2022]TNH04411.1 YchF/TatD family DNA exonuclease [Pasteurellaceae bacterium Phil11]TNH21231.1 YchF/TatD family DNA exonuclease [Testudinibacter sp. TR-2022]TNH22655.1 YchF/TatD family DNA exonuclease [Testudinibacter sp. TR-2022]
MFIVDSHCHLDSLDYEKLHKNMDEVVDKAKARDVQHLLSISTTLSGFERLQTALSHRHEVSLSCGVHPLNVEDEDFDAEKMQRLAQDPKVVAIGECGLDYYYSVENKAKQQVIFSQQIEIAKQLNKPLIIHTRAAREDTMALLQQGQAQQCGGVLHCFTENQWMADQALELGFYISVSGIITFRNAQEIRDVIQTVPLDRLLVETDSPYLAPVPYRGKQNQPAYVREVCEYLAVLKGVSAVELAQITTQNFERLFNVSVLTDSSLTEG